MRFDDLRLSLAIVVAATAHRDMATTDCVELFKLSIEAVSSGTYPYQLAAQLDDPRARLDLLRFIDNGKYESVEIHTTHNPHSSQYGFDATRALMRQLQLLSHNTFNLESQTTLTKSIYHSLQNVFMSCLYDKIQPRIIIMLIDMVGNIRQQTLHQLNSLNNKGQLIGFESLFASTVVRSLIWLLIHPQSPACIQIKIVKMVLDLLNTQDNSVAMSIFKEIITPIYNFASEQRTGNCQCISSLFALLSISALNVEPTRSSQISILVLLAPLSGSKSTITQDVFSEAIKNTLDSIFERTWQLFIKG
ncbi:hypothetical protein J056_004425 [Wallemia ichthyophaga EXF-994]|uniref:Uncharacterized protein n=1 Tax=Wallemia ichthyophaga (strain EXF-994 / CBS 113033) TaxID=1299270 RepID=R9AFV7_WALI9|nr:uncharacterized protein J056_004425 [Wallemia ichthyophaga EXF-994]EOR01104.1 hypothetical protein J056_004425 [Wallemia ichthyophaga EXF-994]